MASKIRVFISHKMEDTPVARAAGNKLSLHGINVYLDVVDPHLDGDGPELGAYIREKLGDCTQLLAVVSETTQNSWWVPWEIGIATEKEYPLATFAVADTVLPTFLWRWPVIRKLTDLREYAEASQKRSVMFAEQASLEGAAAARRDSTAEFHRDLKRRLGQ